ncbi:MAG: gamma carbonic anhydrase family protein [Ignavibacteria bacterium]|nr:gamma carbonic anhydrase family protein [Ignavibacteria bacterium]
MESSKISVKDKNIFNFKDKTPLLHESVFVAAGVRIIGDVTIGEDASIWFNTVIRGDVNFVKIGKLTNVQDGSVLHVTSGTAPLVIGEGVTIGHKACLHGCQINDYSLIGMGAIVLDNAIVEKNAMVAAGAVVRPGFIVPTGKLVAGIPAKIVRDLTPEEIAWFETSAHHYAEYAKEMAGEID